MGGEEDGERRAKAWEAFFCQKAVLILNTDSNKNCSESLNIKMMWISH